MSPSIVRPLIGFLNDQLRVFLFSPEVVGHDNIVNYWVRGDLTKDVKNLQWCPPNYLKIPDQSPISYQELKNEYMECRFLGLPATATAYL